MWIVRLALTRAPTRSSCWRCCCHCSARSRCSARRCAPGCRPTSFRTSASRSSRSSTSYTGLPPDEMAGRITSQTRALRSRRSSTTSSTSSRRPTPASTVIKVFFQPGVDINLAMAQVTAFVADDADAACRPASRRRSILKYNASTRADPAARAVERRSSPSRSSSTSATQFMRAQLATIAGASVPYPVRRRVAPDPGRPRRREALRAQGLSADRRQHGHRQPEPDRAGRHAEDRRHRIQRQAQLEPARRSTSSTTCRSAATSTAPSRTCATSRSCTTAIRRRPTSCASTASARC